MCGGGGVPPPPPLSAEETAINQETLSLLRQSRAEQDALRPLLLDESGLRSKADITGTPEYDRAQELKKNIDIYQKRLDTGTLEFNPSYKLNAADRTYYKELLSGWKTDLAKVSAQYEKTPERLTAEARAKKLQEQVDVATERQLKLYGLEADRQEKALRGELPVSEGTTQRKAQEFAALKEQLTRSGNPVTGDTPETAYSPTTAGTQSLKSFAERYKLVEDAERQGQISQGSADLYNSLGLTSNISGNRAIALQSTGAGGAPYNTLVGGPISLVQPNLQALQPYQFQRSMQYQGNMQNAANAAAERAGYLQLAGTVLGGAAAGGTYKLLSSKSFKKDIRVLSEKDEDIIAMSLTGKRKLYRWKYKTEPDDSKGHIGMVTEESPDVVLADDKKHLDVASYLGALTIGLRSMSRKLDRMERRAYA